MGHGPDPEGLGLMPSPNAPSHPVAIILPVQDRLEATKLCILAGMTEVLAVPGARLFAVIDPRSDSAMRDVLEQLVRQWPGQLGVLESQARLSPSQAVNLGQISCPGHDIVLLKPEAILPKTWLERLVEDAYSRPDIGTVTPLTARASINSFPHPFIDNLRPFDLDIDAVDAAFRGDRLCCIAAPTTEGACLYMRRTWLDAIGGQAFDTDNWVGAALSGGSLSPGWVNTVTPNLYVGEHDGPELGQDQSSERHGDSAAARPDPLRSARIYRYIRLLGQARVPKILHVSHAMGGGVEQHINELAAHFSQLAAHIILSPHGEQGLIRIRLGIARQADQIILHPKKDHADLVRLLRSIGITAVHIHHMMDLGPEILGLAAPLDATSVVTVHDYYGLGGNPTLTDRRGRYPGSYSPKLSRPARLLSFGPSAKTLRAQFHRLVQGADRVIFPSNATKAIFDQAGMRAEASAIIARHIEPTSRAQKRPAKFSKKPLYKIGVLGAISREKGADLLQQLAKRTKSHNFPLQFYLIGYANRPLQGVETSGPYRAEALAGLIRRQALDLVLFPAQCPETYSYTLSSALASGLAIIAPNLGAFPERLSGRANTLIFDHLAPADQILAKITAFIENMAKGLQQNAPRFEGDVSRHDFYKSDYIAITSPRAEVALSRQAALAISELVRIIDRPADRPRPWRNALALWLWRLNANPTIHWLSRLIPYPALRFFKRRLTRTSIQDLIQTKT